VVRVLSNAEWETIRQAIKDRDQFVRLLTAWGAKALFDFVTALREVLKELAMQKLLKTA
jgi:hypothetical protein